MKSILVLALLSVVLVGGVGITEAYEGEIKFDVDGTAHHSIEVREIKEFPITAEKIQQVFEMEQDMQIQQIVYGRSIPEFSNGTLSFLVLDDLRDTLVSVSENDFNSWQVTDKLISTTHTPADLGIFRTFLHEEIPATDSEGTGTVNAFYVVEKFSKTFEKNNECNEGLESVIKPNFSTVVCVTKDTRTSLVERGWVGDFDSVLNIKLSEIEKVYHSYKND